MNHNPIPTENIPTFMLKVVDLTSVLKAIGYPDLLDEGVDVFDEFSFGDAPYTLVTAERAGDIIVAYLSADEDQTFTDEQADRLYDFFGELADASLYINLEG